MNMQENVDKALEIIKTIHKKISETLPPLKEGVYKLFSNAQKYVSGFSKQSDQQPSKTEPAQSVQPPEVAPMKVEPNEHSEAPTQSKEPKIPQP